MPFHSREYGRVRQSSLVCKVIENNYGGHHQTLYSGSVSRVRETGNLRCGDAEQLTRRNETIEPKGKRRTYSSPESVPSNRPTALTALNITALNKENGRIQLALRSAVRVRG